VEMLEQELQMLSLIRCQKVRNFLTTVGLETGPACNYCNSDKCLFDVKEVSESITVGMVRPWKLLILEILDVMLSRSLERLSSCPPRCQICT
jgi:hypothetical protein